jgi:prolyl-tRNA synthetase
MGAVVELNHDDKGIIWPEAVAPFMVHLVSLNQNDKADAIYKDLADKGIEVLYDDREGVSAGEKFADSDLFGIPYRLVVSGKSLAAGGSELKKRNESGARIVNPEELAGLFKN